MDASQPARSELTRYRLPFFVTDNCSKVVDLGPRPVDERAVASVRRVKLSDHNARCHRTARLLVDHAGSAVTVGVREADHHSSRPRIASTRKMVYRNATNATPVARYKPILAMSTTIHNTQ